MDWSAALILAGVTVLEGFRRAPAGAAVARQWFIGPWRREGETPAGGLRLISWASPFVLHLLLPPAEGTVPLPLDLRRRWRRLRRWLPLLRVLAALEVLLLVLGIPVVVGRWGVVGLVVGLVVLGEGALLLVMLSIAALEDGGVPRPAIIRAVRGLLSPFAAPRAPEVVMETLLAGAPPLEALRLLLPRPVYSAMLRPLAYDLEHRGMNGALLATVPRRLLQAALEARPAASAGAPFCPRCGQEYQITIKHCNDCDGVPLVHQG